MRLPRWQDFREWFGQWATLRETRSEGGGFGRLPERDLVLGVRLLVLGVLAYYLFGSGLSSDPAAGQPHLYGQPIHEAWQTALRTVQAFFFLYTACFLGTGLLLIGAPHVQPGALRSLVFGVALLDAWFLAAILALTGGADSLLYWLYFLLIVRNCVSVPATAPQITLNLLTALAYAAGAVADGMITQLDDPAAASPVPGAPDPFNTAVALGRPFHLRLLLLLSASAWAYLLQQVIERQRRRTEEQSELALRREQLAASGRLAAEIAHQLKNPLAIINTASYTLQKTVKEGKTITQQIQIIREEVEKSDRLITELMGYSQLVEGRVEKLELKEELESAIQRVFPAAVKYEMQIHRDYAAGLPNLLAQRPHIQDIFVNVIQNARDILGGRGNLWISTRQGEDFSVHVVFEDDGPGVPAELRERIFEPYFTTRDKGTGLGLAIVKHNAELYGGRVWVESALGRGARFVLQFPARTLMRLRR
jgi:signal transduction histidine kinase